MNATSELCSTGASEAVTSKSYDAPARTANSTFCLGDGLSTEIRMGDPLSRLCSTKKSAFASPKPCSISLWGAVVSHASVTDGQPRIENPREWHVCIQGTKIDG